MAASFSLYDDSFSYDWGRELKTSSKTCFTFASHLNGQRHLDLQKSRRVWKNVVSKPQLIVGILVADKLLFILREDFALLSDLYLVDDSV